MVATGSEFVAAGLGKGGATEFTSEKDQRLFEHAAGLEILDKCSDGLVDADGFAVMVAAHVLVTIPVDTG